MEILYKILIILVCALLGYLFGSISSGIILSQIKYKKDPRDYGSHNSGGTNVGRTFGLKSGLITIFFDVLKTIIPIWTCYFVLKYTGLNQFGMLEYGYLVCAVFTLIGHCYPIYHHFKGGKAVSCFGGVVLATSWALGIYGFILFASVILISKKVSLGSILGSFLIALSSFLLMLLPNFLMNFGMNASILYSCTLIVCSLFLIYRHKSNIVRLIHHEENELHFGKNKKKEA